MTADYDMNDLVSDIAHLRTLISVTSDRVLDIVDPNKQQCDATRAGVSEASDLLCIARDMAEALEARSEACHRQMIEEMKTARKAAKQG